MFINGFDILWDEIDDYVADIKSIRSIDQFMFTKPVTFFCGEDTFNKLGYKAKINTHTMSYIN